MFFNGVGGLFVEGDDEVDVFFGVDVFYVEYVGDIDNVDIVVFYVVVIEWVVGGYEFVFIEEFDDGEVVGDEGVVVFDEGEGVFVFVDFV